MEIYELLVEMMAYMQIILSWRKTSKAVISGTLTQYAPFVNSGNCYVYARQYGNETVLVILSGSDKDVDIDMARYSDVTKGFNSGKDVVTGKVLDIGDKVHVPARGAYILDLFSR